MYVRIDIDPDDVLENMDLEDIVSYLKKHFKVENIIKELDEPIGDVDINTKNLVNCYLHGDLNLKALFQELGRKETEKIFQEVLS